MVHIPLASGAGDTEYHRARIHAELAASHDDFKILARYHHARVSRPVQPLDQREQVGSQGSLRRSFQRGKRLQDRPVISLEYLQPVLGGPVTKYKMTRFHTDR